MDLFYRYLLTVIPINLLELTAFAAGIYFLKNRANTSLANKVLIYFLGFTLLVELLAKYAAIAYFSEYEYFGFVKDTLFERTNWIYNIYIIIMYSFFIYYFGSLLISVKTKSIFKKLSFLFIVVSILNLIFSGVFFKSSSVFISIIGSLLLLIVIIYFYFDLLKTDKIINLKKYLPIYISIGILIFILCETPLSIFSQYFKTINKSFIVLKTNILLLVNIIMYGTFITGFIITAKSNSNKEEILN